MLGWFRKKQKMIFYAIVIPIGLMMGFSYTVMRVLQGSREEPFYTVGGERVEDRTVQARMYRLNGVRSKIASLLPFSSLRQTTAEGTVDRYLLLDVAERSGIQVPISEVGRRARDFYAGVVAFRKVWPLLQGMDPAIREREGDRLFRQQKEAVKFDRQEYEDLLGGKADLTIFERYLLEEITLEKLRDLVRRAGRTDPEEVFEKFVEENQKKKIGILQLQAKEFSREVDFLLKEDPKDHYERVRKTLVEPAELSLEYVFLPFEGVDVPEPTDEEVQAHYDEHRSEFRDKQSGEVCPLDQVRAEILTTLQGGKREGRAKEILQEVRDLVSGGEGDLAAVAKEKADLEVKAPGRLTLEAFQELPEIGIESVFAAALGEEKGALGEVGSVFEKGAYLYRVVETALSREKAYAEVAEEIRTEVETLYQADLLHYFERNRDRYAKPTLYRMEYVRGPGGDDLTQTRTALSDLRKEIEKKRRAGNDVDLQSEVSGDLEYFRTEGPVSLESLGKKEGIEPADLVSQMERVRGGLSYPWPVDEQVYLFRVLEEIEADVTLEDVLDRVEKDAAADTERAVRRAFERAADRLRRPLEVDGEALLADVSAILADTEPPSEEKVEAYYLDQMEAYLLAGEEKDPETGSRYRGLDEVKGEIAEGLRRREARKRGKTILETLASGGGEGSLADLLAAASPESRPYLRHLALESLAAEGAGDHEEIGSGSLAMALEGLSPNAISGPYEGVKGPFLFRAAKVRKASFPGLDGARSQVEAVLLADRDEFLQEANLSAHREREKHEVEYLIARHKDYFSKTEVPTDEDIQDEYDVRKEEYRKDPSEIEPETPEEEKYRPLAEVRDELIQTLRGEEAANLAKEDIEKARKEMEKDEKEKSRQDFEFYRVLSDRLVLERPEPLEWSDLTSHDDLESPDLRSFLRQAKEEDLTKVILNTHEEARYILRMKKKTPARVPDLAEVASEVKKTFYLAEAMDVIEERLEVVREKVEEEGRPLAEVAGEFGYSVLESDFISKTDRYLTGVSSPFMVIRQAFSVEEGKRLTDPILDRYSRHRGILVEPLESEAPDPDGFSEKEEQLRKSLEGEAQDEFQARWEAKTLMEARDLQEGSLEEMYEKHFRREVRVRHLLVRLHPPPTRGVFSESRRASGYRYPGMRVAMKAARTRAEKAYADLLHFEPFAKLAKYSEDGGRLPPRTRQWLEKTWGEEVARAIAETPAGSFTQPLESEESYLLFLVEERKGEDLHLRQIRFEVTPGRFPRGQEDEVKEIARAEAEEIRSRIVEGKSMAGLAVELWDFATSPATAGGELGKVGYADRNIYPEELVDAVLAAEVGELSEVIESPLGYHIFRVNARQDVPLDEVWLDVALQVIDENPYLRTNPSAKEEKKEGEEGGEETGEDVEGREETEEEQEGDPGE